MIVHVRGYLTFAAPIGKKDVELEPGASLRALLSELAGGGAEALGSALAAAVDGVLRGASVLVNGRHYSHTEMGLDLPLQDGDEVAIFPPAAGG